MKKIRPKTHLAETKTLNFASLTQISQVLGASLDMDKLLNIILRAIMEQTNSDSGSLMLLDESTQYLSIRAYQGINATFAKKTKIRLGEGISGVVALKRKPLIIDNTTFFSVFKKKPRPGLKSSLSVPLLLGEKLTGVINLNRIPGSPEFTTEDLEEISLFARESAIAINNAQLYIAAEEKIQNLFRFNVISCALNSVLDPQKLISILTDCMLELFIFDIFTFLTIEEKNYCLLICSHNPLSSKALNNLKNNIGMLISSIKKEPITQNNLSVTIKTVKNHTNYSPAKILPKHLNTVMNAPISSKGTIIGMLSVYSAKEKGFNQKDQQTLTTLANQSATALENATLYKNLRKTYLSTIKALAQAIEEKDIYTRGHSDKVAYYAVCLAQALHLPDKLIECLQIAGILHDIGKIGIPEIILSKPSTLTREEYEIIKKHPIIGKRILEPVNFFWGETSSTNFCQNISVQTTLINKNKKAFYGFKPPLQKTLEILKTIDLSTEIIDIIYHHHERYGGNGYPAGQKGSDIPIGSRILAVADTFEAMTANRPYRKAFSLQKALKLLKKACPEQLDPKIVDVFIKLVKGKHITAKFNTLNSMEGSKFDGRK